MILGQTFVSTRQGNPFAWSVPSVQTLGLLTALTALGLGQTMFGLRNETKQSAYLQGSSKWRAFFCAALTTQKRYDCSPAFPCAEVLCTNSTLARLYILLYLLNDF